MTRGRILNYFVVVKTDTFSVDEAVYVVNTSISRFIYRTEVFRDEVLIDTIEVNCTELSKHSMGNQLFMDKYEQAHNKKRVKCGSRDKNKKDESKGVFEKKQNKFINNVKSKGSILLVLAIISGLISYFIIIKVFIYSDIYINTIIAKKDKMVYLEQIETKTHKLGDACVLLSKKQSQSNNIVTAENCKVWCNRRIISKETCDLFSAYFFIDKGIKEGEHTDKQVTAYKVFPQEEIVELHLSKTFKLKVHNDSNHELYIELKSISLNNSINEEIVQFKKTETSFSLQEAEGKYFQVFLEPSYYKQFELGKYTGSLWFDVKYQEKIVGSINKQFYFMVK